jgi:hypothetical protein
MGAEVLDEELSRLFIKRPLNQHAMLGLVVHKILQS